MRVLYYFILLYEIILFLGNILFFGIPNNSSLG